LVFSNAGHHIHGSPVYWRSRARGPVIYVWAENDVLRAFAFDERTKRLVGGGCAAKPPALAWSVGRELSPAHLHMGMTGGMLSISSNHGASGIVWATTPTNNDANQKIVPGILRAYPATDLRHELWNSYRNRDRDDLGNFAKHAPPTVANGKVFVASFSQHVSVYGMHAPKPPAPATNLIVNGDFEDGTNGWTFEGQGDVNSAYPYYGVKQATLCAQRDRGARLWQDVTAPESGSYVLTAYAGTNIRMGNVSQSVAIREVQLGVAVEGVQLTGQRVVPFDGLQRHTITIDAQKGARIRVWYSAPAASPLPFFGATPEESQPLLYAVLDAVSLTRR
jgi:outer membrane protein assembly factor BamB